MAFLLPLLVLAPMCFAPISYLIGRRSKRARNAFVCLLLTAECALAGYLLWQAALGEALAFDWAGFGGFGLHFRLDGFRALYALIAAFLWMMTGFFSPQYFAHYHNRNRYYFFLLLTLGATAGLFLSDDLYTVFLFFEAMGFTGYVLVAHDEKPAAMRAAGTYLAVSVVGGMVTLMGLLLLWRSVGTLRFEALRTADGRSLYLPGALVAFGFAARAGVFPLHFWLPKEGPAAPAPVSALFSGVLTKTGVFGLLAVSCNLFLHDAAWGNAVLAFGVATMFGGALLAMFSVNLKRTLACSSMSQIGFILVGVGMQCLLGHHNALAVQGTLLHMVNHSLIKLCLFMAAGAVVMNLHKLELNDIRGFGRNKPVLHFAFLMGALGISGVPLWNGYISKSLLHESLLEYIELLREGGASAFWYGAAEKAFIVTGGMTFSYMLKLYIAIFWEKNPARQAEFDGMRKTYLRPLSAFALLGAALVLPALGMLPDKLMTGIATLGQGFLHGESPAHAVAYFSAENLIGAGKSLLIGGALYLLVIRPLLMKRERAAARINVNGIGYARRPRGARVYVNRWPAWLDLENLFLRGPFPQKCVAAPIAGVARAADEAADAVATVISDSLLRKGAGPREAPVGNPFTRTLGRALNALVRLLNKTVCRAHPIEADFAYRSDVK